MLSDDLREAAVAPVAAACSGRVGHDDDVPEGALVTCFDVLDRAERIAPVVESLLLAARERGATVVVSVPNDALGGVGGASTWGEGSVAELRSLLPGDHVVAGVFELAGSAIVREGAPESVEVRGTPSGAPAGWLLAFGPHAGLLAAPAAVEPVDRAERRRAERALITELEALRSAVQGGTQDGPPKQLPAGS